MARLLVSIRFSLTDNNNIITVRDCAKLYHFGREKVFSSVATGFGPSNILKRVT